MLRFGWRAVALVLAVALLAYCKARVVGTVLTPA